MFECKQHDKMWFLWAILDYHIEKNHETTGLGETLRGRKKNHQLNAKHGN